MRAYLVVTGIIFALVTIAHIVRVAMESTRFVTEPDFVILTILAASLSVWAVVLLRRSNR